MRGWVRLNRSWRLRVEEGANASGLVIRQAIEPFHQDCPATDYHFGMADFARHRVHERLNAVAGPIAFLQTWRKRSHDPRE
jgi:hypothetical protein